MPAGLLSVQRPLLQGSHTPHLYREPNRREQPVGQHWDFNPVTDLGNVGSDLWSFLSGPPGDPGRIRQVASQIEAMGHEYEGHVTAINEAVDELGHVWTGDAAKAFVTAWQSPEKTAPKKR